ncbi:MAG: Uma2 family endonuclease [Nitrospirae bacterium]|nr:Uma2 family endonuclease [Nitrospirota bacterium]
MTFHSQNVKFTYEDYLLFPEDGKRHELIDGEHHMTPAPSTRHQRISRRLLTAFENFLKNSKRGEVFYAPTDVVLSDMDVVQPDLLIVLAPHASIITEKCIQGVPDLLVEILSETTRKIDEVVKRKLYERYGVQEYWIVDPELETVKIYRMTERGYARADEVSLEGGDALSTPLLPGLQISLSEIFE